MLVIKKILILAKVADSGVSGVLRLENFGGRSSCDIKLMGGVQDWWLGLFVEDQLVLCTNKQGKIYLDKMIDLSKPIACIVMSGDDVVCVGCINKAVTKHSKMKGQIEQYKDWYKQECKLASMQSENRGEDNKKVDTYPQNVMNEEQEALQDIVGGEDIKNIEDESQEDFEPLSIEPNTTVDQSSVLENAFQQENEVSNNRENDEQEEIVQSTLKEEPKIAKEQTKPKGKDNQDKSTSRFFDSIRSQMHKLFSEYEKDTQLEELVSDSKWVRVPTEDGYYVVGIISSEDEPQLLCYGVPDEDASNPPDCDKACRQWLALDENKGYWMMYQCAKTGEMLQDNQIVK